jgi:hypothetical protein
MFKAVAAIGIIFFCVLAFFTSFIAAANYGMHSNPNSDGTENLTDQQIEAKFSEDAPLDPSLVGTDQEFVCTFYYPDNPQDPLGGGNTCSDGSIYYRDPGKPAVSNLFLHTSDGRNIQGSLAVPLNEFHPLVPLGCSPAIKIQVPGYAGEQAAEVHDHFGSLPRSGGNRWQCTLPNRIDIAASGPEEEAAVVKYWKDNNLMLGDTSSDPNPMNHGTRVMCQIISEEPNVPADINLPDYSNLSTYRQLLLRLLLSKLNCYYIYGAAGPDTFDCSGLVMWAYASIGNSRPGDIHWTGAQCNAGVRISGSQAIPGDAVYFGSGLPHHVGIYIGGGNFIEAHGLGASTDHPTPGMVVRIRPLSCRNDINCWVRFMDPDKDSSTQSSFQSGDDATFSMLSQSVPACSSFLALYRPQSDFARACRIKG